MSPNILYEDNHLIAVYKPSGVLVQGNHTGAPTLMDEVKYYLKQQYHKPGNVFLGLLHRLDRPVAGIVLFAKTSKGASRLSEQFRDHTIKKTYHALVVGSVAVDQRTLVHFLKKDPSLNKVSVTECPAPGTQRAELSFRVLGRATRQSLLEIELKTGRPHQIRAQLAAIGHPIVGDVKYGAPAALYNKSLLLAAVRLEFNLPTKDEKQVIEIASPIQAGFDRENERVATRPSSGTTI